MEIRASKNFRIQHKPKPMKQSSQNKFTKGSVLMKTQNDCMVREIQEFVIPKKFNCVSRGRVEKNQNKLKKKDMEQQPAKSPVKLTENR